MRRLVHLVGHPLLVCLLLLVRTMYGEAQATETVLILSPAPYQLDTPITLNAEVTQAVGQLAGTVDFYDGLRLIRSAQLVTITGGTHAQAAATILLPSGAHVLSARFNATVTSLGSTSEVRSIVVEGTWKPTLQLTPAAGQKFDFQAFGPGSKPVSGTITLTDVTGQALGSVNLDSLTAQDSLLVRPASAVPKSNYSVLFDANGDGYPDLAVASLTEGTLQILLGGPQPGSFTRGASLNINVVASGLIAADFNGDGHVDLAVISAVSSTLQIFFGDPNRPGTFIQSGSPLPLPAGPSAILSADFNRDGLPDLAVASGAANSVSVLLNNINDPGHFLSAQTLDVGASPISIVAADLRQTGLIDLAVLNFSDESISVLQNNVEHPGVFLEADTGAWAAGIGATSVVAADFDGDGIPDLAVCNALENTISLLPGQRDELGTFPTQRLTPVTGCSSLMPIDFDSDGLTDLVVMDQTNSALSVLRNTGYGLFKLEQTLQLGPQPQLVAVDDITGGIHADFVIVDGALGIAQVVQHGWRSTISVVPSSSPKTKLIATLVPPVESEYASANTTAAVVQTSTTDANSVSSATKQTQSITLANAGKPTYGDAPLAISASASSGLPVSLSVVSGPGRIEKGKLSILGSGSVLLEAIQEGDGTFQQTTKRISLYVERKSLIVSPNTATRCAGRENPAFSGTLVGLVAGDQIAATFTSAANSETPSGVYADLPFAIVPSLLDRAGRLRNYDVTAQLATITIADCAPGSSPRPPVAVPPRMPSPFPQQPIGPVRPIGPPTGTVIPIKPVQLPSPPEAVPPRTANPPVILQPVTGTSPNEEVPKPTVSPTLAPTPVTPPVSGPTIFPPPTLPAPSVVPLPLLPPIATPAVPPTPVSVPVTPPVGGPTTVPSPTLPAPPVVSSPVLPPVATPPVVKPPKIGAPPLGKAPRVVHKPRVVEVPRPVVLPPKVVISSGARLPTETILALELVPQLGTLIGQALAAANGAFHALAAVHHTQDPKRPTAVAISADRSSTNAGARIVVVAAVMTPLGPLASGTVGFYRDGELISKEGLRSDGTAVAILADDSSKHIYTAQFLGSHKLKSSHSNSRLIDQVPQQGGVVLPDDFGALDSDAWSLLNEPYLGSIVPFR